MACEGCRRRAQWMREQLNAMRSGIASLRVPGTTQFRPIAPPSMDSSHTSTAASKPDNEAKS